MAREVCQPAVEQALRQWVLPPCLHVPIAALDQAAIERHIGDVVSVISEGRALLVRADPLPEPDQRLPIFAHPNVANLRETLQVWVSPTYKGYRAAWIKALGMETIRGKILHHVFHRRTALRRGFGLVRLAPILRATNTSAAFAERWQFEFEGPNPAERGLSIQYADLFDLVTLLDISPGGGVMDVVNEAQALVTVSGTKGG
jgi:hypothetical protein